MTGLSRNERLLFWGLACLQALLIVSSVFLWIRSGQSPHGEMPTHGMAFVTIGAVFSFLLLLLWKAAKGIGGGRR